MTQPCRYRFGIYQFDENALELRKSGHRVRLRPQALKLLRLLIANSRELVTRDQIIRELWGGDVFVDFEQGVNHTIKQLRAALGDHAGAPRYIETVPRRGYRFVAPVELMPVGEARPAPPPLTTPQGPRRARSGRRTAGLVAAAVVVTGLVILAFTLAVRRPPPAQARPTTLAVLPLNVTSMPAELRYLGLSLADAVTGRLSVVPALRVRPIDSTRQYDGGATDIETVSRTLQVDYVLVGTLTRRGAVMRADLSLVRSGRVRPIWQGSLDRSNVLELEGAIAARVVAALAASPPVAGQAPENPAAHEAYLLGRFYLARFTSEDTLRAIAAFEAALAVDATHPLAHAGLAKASAQMFLRFAAEGQTAIWQVRAEQHARRAVELGPTLAEGHEALAAVARHIDFDWGRVIEESAEALRFNHSLDLAHYYLASALQHIGRLEMVEAQVIAGLEANPLNLAEAYRLRGTTALWAGRFADARTHLERVRELTSKPVSYTPLAQALYYAGDTAQAEAMLAGLRGSAQSEQRARAMLASIVAARDESRALALVDEVLVREYRDHHVAYSLGATYAVLGRPAHSFRWLREAAATGFLCHPWYARDPLLQSLRAHPGFQLFLDEVKAAADRISTERLSERGGAVNRPADRELHNRRLVR